MRKETITKYEKEFLAWCKNESVLLGAPASTHDKTLIWREVRDFNDWEPLDTVYVLNDSYSHYRKALAEGKTIQFKTGDCRNWVDINDPKFSQPLTSYRVKPEEPKFKTGDWIRQGDYVIKVHRMDSDYYYDKVKGCIAIDKAEKWEPKRGELCWFWTPAEKLIPKLGKFLQMERHNQYYASFGNGNYTCSSHLFCEPFIGELPEYIKELKL